MKILHTSDWHLGMMHRTHSFEEDQIFFAEQICRILREEKIDAVMLCGDVYDRSVPNISAVKLYNRIVTQICGELGVKLLIVAGNHDNAARLSTYDALVRMAGLHVVGELTADLTPVSVGNADIYMLPWFSTERARAVFPEHAEKIDSMQAAYQVVLDRIRERMRPDRRQIVMAHAFIVDAATSVSDRSAEVGRAASVSRDVFAGFDYVALGHIHGPQNIGDTIRYCGSPMKYSFGREESQEKSVTILDTDTLERKILPIPALHERITLSGHLEDILSAKNVTQAQRVGYVRVQADDSHIGLDAASRLREVYPNLLEYSGILFDREDGSITMSLEELEKNTDDPMQIFARFYEDNVNGSPDDHLMALFRQAVEAYERSEQA